MGNSESSRQNLLKPDASNEKFVPSNDWPSDPHGQPNCTQSTDESLLYTSAGDVSVQNGTYAELEDPSELSFSNIHASFLASMLSSKATNLEGSFQPLYSLLDAQRLITHGPEYVAMCATFIMSTLKLYGQCVPSDGQVTNDQSQLMFRVLNDLNELLTKMKYDNWHLPQIASRKLSCFSCELKQVVLKHSSLQNSRFNDKFCSACLAFVPKCDLLSHSWSDYHINIRNQLMRQIYPYSCQKCHKKFSHEVDLQSHECMPVSVGNGNHEFDSFACLLCLKPFTSETDLHRHRTTSLKHGCRKEMAMEISLRSYQKSSCHFYATSKNDTSMQILQGTNQAKENNCITPADINTNITSAQYYCGPCSVNVPKANVLDHEAGSKHKKNCNAWVAFYQKESQKSAITHNPTLKEICSETEVSALCPSEQIKIDSISQEENHQPPVKISPADSSIIDDETIEEYWKYVLKEVLSLEEEHLIADKVFCSLCNVEVTDFSMMIHVLEHHLVIHWAEKQSITVMQEKLKELRKLKDMELNNFALDLIQSATVKIQNWIEIAQKNGGKINLLENRIEPKKPFVRSEDTLNSKRYVQEECHASDGLEFVDKAIISFKKSCTSSKLKRKEKLNMCPVLFQSATGKLENLFEINQQVADKACLRQNATEKTSEIPEEEFNKECNLPTECLPFNNLNIPQNVIINTEIGLSEVDQKFDEVSKTSRLNVTQANNFTSTENLIDVNEIQIQVSDSLASTSCNKVAKLTALNQSFVEVSSQPNSENAFVIGDDVSCSLQEQFRKICGDKECSDFAMECGTCGALFTVFNEDIDLSLELHINDDPQHSLAVARPVERDAQNMSEISNTPSSNGTTRRGHQSTGCKVSITKVPSNHKKRVIEEVMILERRYIESHPDQQYFCTLCSFLRNNETSFFFHLCSLTHISLKWADDHSLEELQEKLKKIKALLLLRYAGSAITSAVGRITSLIKQKKFNLPTFFCELCGINELVNNKKEHMDGKTHKSLEAKRGRIAMFFLCDICGIAIDVSSKECHVNSKRHKNLKAKLVQNESDTSTENLINDNEAQMSVSNSLALTSCNKVAKLTPLSQRFVEQHSCSIQEKRECESAKVAQHCFTSPSAPQAGKLLQGGSDEHKKWLIDQVFSLESENLEMVSSNKYRCSLCKIECTEIGMICHLLGSHLKTPWAESSRVHEKLNILISLEPHDFYKFGFNKAITRINKLMKRMKKIVRRNRKEAPINLPVDEFPVDNACGEASSLSDSEIDFVIADNVPCSFQFHKICEDKECSESSKKRVIEEVLFLERRYTKTHPDQKYFCTLCTILCISEYQFFHHLLSTHISQKWADEHSLEELQEKLNKIKDLLPLKYAVSATTSAVSKVTSLIEQKELNRLTFFCEICGIYVLVNNKKEHIDGKTHKSLEAKGGQIATFFNHDISHKQSHVVGKRHKKLKFYCELCRISMHVNNKESHMNGKTHKFYEAALGQCSKH